MSNKTIEIDRHVPLPKARTKNIRLYPWLDMKVGDSFVVAGKVAACAARGSFRRYQKMGKMPANWRVKQQVVEGDTAGSSFVTYVRLWLIEE
jgi:hypothetical protein